MFLLPLITLTNSRNVKARQALEWHHISISIINEAVQRYFVFCFHNEIRQLDH